MTKDEALRIAWVALHQIAEVSATDYEYQQWANEAITAIKAAIEAEDGPAVCRFCQDPTNYGAKYFNTRCADCMRRLTEPRTWVGLTDEEREEIALELPIDAVSITEAKLKERNT